MSTETKTEDENPKIFCMICQEDITKDFLKFYKCGRCEYQFHEYCINAIDMYQRHDCVHCKAHDSIRLNKDKYDSVGKLLIKLVSTIHDGLYEHNDVYGDINMFKYAENRNMLMKLAVVGTILINFHKKSSEFGDLTQQCDEILSSCF